MEVYHPISQPTGALPAIIGYKKGVIMRRNPALHMFQQLWGQELQGHPRFFELLLQMAEMHSKKDHDYTADGIPYSNIRESADEVGIPAWKASLIRLGDKRSRLRTFARDIKNQVCSEKIEDTLLDLAVYSLITLILYEEENANEKASTPTLKTSNEPEDRSHPSGKISEKLNTAFQSGYKEKNTGQEDTSVPEVSQPECPRDDGSSPRVGQSPS